MLATFSLIILLGLLANFVFSKLHLPGFLGMLFLGILISPSVFNLIDTETIKLSADLRKIALIIIILRAGLGINKNDLNKVGMIALRLSFIPCLLEGFFIAIIATKLLGFSFVEGGILGFIISSVSPAVIVPAMIIMLQ